MQENDNALDIIGLKIVNQFNLFLENYLMVLNYEIEFPKHTNDENKMMLPFI